MTTTILTDLTRDLLNSGVFSHLPDDEIARLHWMILRMRDADKVSVQPLLTYWYRGDYYTSNASPRLLQQCNEYLQRLGQPLIDVYGEEFYEA